MATDNRSRKLSFSSEQTVVQRWFGGEVLDHSPGSVRMDFMKSGRAPLLLNHDTRQQIGVMDDASIGKDRIGRGSARFGRTQISSDALQNVDDGILTNTSVGYRVYEMVLDNSQKRSDEDIYRVIDWEPYEATLCAVPADQAVGVGRASHEGTSTHPPDLPDKSSSTSSTEPRSERGSSFSGSNSAGVAGQRPKEDIKVSDEINAATANGGTSTREGEGDSTSRASGGESNAAAASAAAAAAARRGEELNGEAIEKSRLKAIGNMCKSNRIEERLQRYWTSSGMSVEEVSEELLRVIEERGKANPQPISKLEMTRDEVQTFSVRKAILAAHSGDWSKAGFEGECSRTIAAKLNVVGDPKKFFVPYDVQQRGISRTDIAKRDLMFGNRNGMGAMSRAVDTVGVGSAGGYLVATELVSFIDLLRNRTVAFRMGARSLAGLVGNVTIPKLTGAATAYWLGSETTQITETNQVFSQLALTPHNVGGYTEISRQLLMQSTPDVEGIVNSDLAIITALAVDLGALSGTGTSGQPVGITNTSGIGAATSGDMSTIGYLGCLDFQYQVWNANVVPVRGGYVTNGNVAELLMTRTKFANTYSPLWDGTMWDADCCGFPGMSSKQIAASTMLFGDWDQLIIAEWGVLELEVNPYANFQAGIIGVRSFMTCDIGLRYPGAFAQNGATIT
jgi:HK97 family phage major capsid protein